MSTEVAAAIAGGLFTLAAAVFTYFFQRRNEYNLHKREIDRAERARLNADVTTYSKMITTAIHKIEWLTWMAKNYGDASLVRAEIKQYQKSMYDLWAEIDSALLAVAARSSEMHDTIKRHELRLRKLDEDVAIAAKPLVIESDPDNASNAIERLGELHEQANSFWKQFGEAMKQVIQPVH